jgi:hypothetical protein
VRSDTQNDQHGASVAVIAHAPPSAEDAVTVFPQYLVAAVRIAFTGRPGSEISMMPTESQSATPSGEPLLCVGTDIRCCDRRAGGHTVGGLNPNHRFCYQDYYGATNLWSPALHGLYL